MQRSDLVRVVGNRLNIPEEQCSAVITALFDEIERALARDEGVIIRGFGAFRLARIAGSLRPNPGTGVRTLFPPSLTVRWKPANRLRTLVNDCLVAGDK